MSRKLIWILVAFLVLALPAGVVMAQEEEGHPIVTTANNVVGVGSYVAAYSGALAAGEDPAEEPAQAFVMPFGIYPAMHVMDVAEFEQPEMPEQFAGFTFEWALAVPEGSAAELVADGFVAIFLADVEGEYTLSLTATDEAGNVAEASWVVTAATYVGVGGIVGDAVPPECAVCHADQAAMWAETGHSEIFTLGLEGILSDHYSESCIICHTTGYDPLETAVNGGFDDVQAEAGWVFPEELSEGTWDALIAEYPTVAAMGNIQCESCHGPGSVHMGAGAIGGNLSTGTCAVCHGEEPRHTKAIEWENSGHGQIGGAWWAEVGRAECARCHSGDGFVDYTKGVPAEESRSGPQNLSCASCHDPHDTTNLYQLRVVGEVVLPNGMTGDAGTSATCMSCHNGRREGGAEGQVAAGLEPDGRMSTPHHNQAAAELMFSTGGYTWGVELPSSPHGVILEGTCTDCHMAAPPGWDADGNFLPGHDEVGGHSFNMVSADGLEHLEACTDCHTYMDSFEFPARGDYDGDGAIETHEEEVAGLLEALNAALLDAGVTDPAGRSFALPEGQETSEELLGAIYNYQFGMSSGAAFHNFKYVVSLLQLSCEKVTGEPLAGAELLY